MAVKCAIIPWFLYVLDVFMAYSFQSRKDASRKAAMTKKVEFVLPCCFLKISKKLKTKHSVNQKTSFGWKKCKQRKEKLVWRAKLAHFLYISVFLGRYARSIPANRYDLGRINTTWTSKIRQYDLRSENTLSKWEKTTFMASVFGRFAILFWPCMASFFGVFFGRL